MFLHRLVNFHRKDGSNVKGHYAIITDGKRLNEPIKDFITNNKELGFQ